MSPLDSDCLSTLASLLAPYSATLFALQGMILNEDSSNREIVALIEKDPVITGKILRVANSAYYGMRYKIDSISSALRLIGLRPTADLVLGICAFSSFSGKLNSFFLRRMARHSVGVATLCSLITKMLGRSPEGAEYTAGLVHDLGIAVIAVCKPERAGIFMKLGDTFPLNQETERELFDTDHCEAGSLLAKRWQFPEALAESMGTHHQPIRNDKAFSVPALVRIAVHLEGLLATGSEKVQSAPGIPRGHFAADLSLEELNNELRAGLEETTDLANLVAR
jgi:HD-like signal output (HDOD) protein